MDPESIRDLFSGLGPLRIRRMFEGQGVYAGDLIFALELGGELYLKTNEILLPALRSAGSRPFVYENRGRTVQTSYWRLPDAAIDDPEEAARWGRLALQAAMQAAITRKPKGAVRRRR